jgi:carotene biosynthesis associated membrane protein
VRLPVVLAGATVLLQISYPLTGGGLTVLTVIVFFAASTSHALLTRGSGWTLRLLAVALGLSLAAEALGVATGYPFGSYRYAGSLGPEVLSVPVVVPLAWTMMGYPCLLVGQHLAAGRAGVLLGALALTTWDLFLDPQLVRAGHWEWQHPDPGLNGIPLTNTAGWLLVSVTLMTVLSRLPRIAADDRVPTALFLWTYGSSLLANVAFFGRPGVALVGGVGMGLVTLPYVWSLAR